jgi:hypothetical protein
MRLRVDIRYLWWIHEITAGKGESYQSCKLYSGHDVPPYSTYYDEVDEGVGGRLLIE